MITEYEQLRSFIDRVRRRWLLLVTLRTLSLSAAAAAVPAFAAIGLNRLLAPQGGALLLLAAAALAASLIAAIACVWRTQSRPNDRRVARFIEERAAAADLPSLDDALVSAVDIASAERSSTALGNLVVHAALERVLTIEPAQIISTIVIRRAAVQTLSGAALLSLALVLAMPSLMQAFETAWIAIFPTAIHVDVLPGDVRVVAGKPLQIRAVVRAGQRVLTRSIPSLTITAGAERRTFPMIEDGNAFIFSISSVDRTFRYSVAAAAVISREFTATALVPPRVRRIDVRYEYPSFTGLRPRDEQDGGDIYAPAGTRVRVRIHTDKPVTTGAMAFTGAPTQTLRGVGERLLEADFELSRDGSYRVLLADADGLRSSGETEYFIRLMDDRPPEVRILRPAGDQQVTPLEEVAIEARADDDYGIAGFELVYSVAGARERVRTFSHISGTDVSRVGAYVLAIEDLGVRPGDVVTYYARARDVGRGKRSTEAKSDMFFLEVRPFNEEFVAAQSQVGAAGMQIESLIAAQKEIINATWNIERRSAVGRSKEDVDAVRRAQAELKTRVEQMASGGGRGGSPLRAPQQVSAQRGSREPGENPIAGAIRAMGEALQQLDGQRTKDAIPHEMAALRGLLQAQAEVRRREVSQQAGASGGGAGRQGQDLSSLFDRELQRQQRTNYETRSHTEDRPDGRTDGALEKIRELARRQEDLSRRQRDLAAAGLSADELKRQLETLTREQTELREQAEELARLMSGARSSARAARAQQSGEATSKQDAPRGGGDVRDASETMRSAASELRRQDPNTAAQSASRAAEQLRRAERQLQDASPDGRQRAEGELQLETRQIADAQRRVANEADRMEKGDASARGDALRRLAADKDRLADRVDRLQRNARDLAKRGAGDPVREGQSVEGAAETARELQRQKISERMRDSAAKMREGAARQANTATPLAGAAATEQQIADALDQIAGRLGGGAGADARKLSEQLGETRDLRERLDRLERRIREAEAQQSPRRARQGAPDADGREGERGRQGSTGSGSGGELQKLRDEYARELQKARETLARLQQGTPRDGLGGSTPEQQEFSLSSPGTEAFKQDFAKWESLRKNVRDALERQETGISERLARKLSEDRLNAGGSERMPDAYRRLIARYYESLANTKR